MDIRRKTIVIVCITLLCLIIALYVSSNVIVQGGFSRVESQSAEKDTNRVLVSLGNEINTLDAAANDWASREETRALVSSNVSARQWSTLHPEVFEGLGFNAILLADEEGNLVAGQGYDLANRTLMPVPAGLGMILTREARGRQPDNPYPGMMGVIALPEGPMLIAVRPVYHEPGSRLITGYLLMGRYLDDREISRLSTLAQLPVEFFPYDNRTVPADVGRSIPAFESSSRPFLERGGNETILLYAPTLISPVDSKTLRTYSLIRDVSGSPILVLRISIDRDIFAQGTSTTLYFVMLLIIAGIIFGLVTILLLEKTVLSRLARLSWRVNDIGRKRDFSARVDIHGEDEIGGLAGNVNGMLEDLEESQKALHNRLIQSEEHYRLLFNSITDPVCVCRLNPDHLPGKVVEVNDAACEVLGYLRTEFMALDLSDLLPGKAAGGVDLPAEVLRSFRHVIYAGVCKTKSGTMIPVEINARTFDQFGRPAFVAIIRDVSEREEIERLKREAFGQIEKNIQQFAILNDHIRNPLQGMMGLADMMDDPQAKKIIKYGQMIDDIVKKIDLGYYESEKIYKVLRKYYDIGRK